LEWNNHLVEKYEIKKELFFNDKNNDYFVFRNINQKQNIKKVVEESNELKGVEEKLHSILCPLFSSLNTPLVRSTTSRGDLMFIHLTNYSSYEE